MMRWLASKKPEMVETHDRLRQRLETMSDRETRLYLRIAAWDTLGAAADLRNQQESGESEDIDE
jgi:hypothetical protein